MFILACTKLQIVYYYYITHFLCVCAVVFAKLIWGVVQSTLPCPAQPMDWLAWHKMLQGEQAF